MRKFLTAIFILSLIITPAFSSNSDEFNFNFPRARQNTLNDWAMASQIVQNIQRPNIPAKEIRLNLTSSEARDAHKIIQEAIDKTSSEGGGKIILKNAAYAPAEIVNSNGTVLKSYSGPGH